MSIHIRKLNPLSSSRSPSVSADSVILVTGGGSGIGLNTALVYAKRRVKLVIADLNEQAAKDAAERCNQLGSTALPYQLDVTDPAQVKSLIDYTITKFTRIDVLLLCAGLGGHHLFQSTQGTAIFRKLMEVNFYGYLNCVQAAFPYLTVSDKSLRPATAPRPLVIAITSFSGEVGLPYRTAYSSSKYAITGFLEALRAEMRVMEDENKGKFQGFDITIVCPPTVNTNLRKNSVTPDPSLKDHAESAKAGMTVEECAVAVVDAGDRRLRKAFFPLKAWAAAYLRPIVPDLIDSFIMAKAKL